jgi:LysR family nitrogen assimilation transcriptional regulator
MPDRRPPGRWQWPPDPDNLPGMGLAPPGGDPINLRQLQYFVKVVELANMTRAAEQLHVAQPALGLQIRQLEEGLGVDLLMRHSRGVEPTPAGKLLFERAIQILRAVEDTRREVMRLQPDQMETAVVGLSPSLMRLLGTEILVRARQELPGLTLHLVEELSFGLLDAMERGEIGVALAYQANERVGLERRPIFEEELLLIRAPLPGAPDCVGFAEVLEQDLVLAGGKDAVWRLAEVAAGRLSIPFRVAYEAQSIEAMKDMVRRGVAASIMPFGTAMREIRSGEVLAQRIVDPALKRILYLVRPAGQIPTRHREALDRFLLNMLEKAVAELGPLAAWIGSAPGRHT